MCKVSPFITKEAQVYTTLTLLDISNSTYRKVETIHEPLCSCSPEVEEADGADGGEGEAGEDDRVGPAGHQLPPPVEDPLQGPDDRLAAARHHGHLTALAQHFTLNCKLSLV